MAAWKKCFGAKTALQSLTETGSMKSGRSRRLSQGRWAGLFPNGRFSRRKARDEQTGASPARQTAQQQNQQEQTVTGKVTSIGSDRRSFSLEVDDGGSKKTMQFVLDNKTQVQGRVTEGTMAKVEYQPMEGGKNLAIVVTAQS